MSVGSWLALAVVLTIVWVGLTPGLRRKLWRRVR
jgi:hypothetical protein